MDVQAARKARPSKGLIPNKTPPEREPAIESEEESPEAESRRAAPGCHAAAARWSKKTSPTEPAR